MISKSSFIAIAEDSSMFHYILRKVIAEMDCFQITIEVSNGKELIDKLEKAYQLPEICILDIGMPVMNGYEAIRVIKKRWPSVRVLVFSQHYHSYVVGTMLNAGASGFISKDENPEYLIEAIRSVKEYGCFYSNHAPKEMFDKVEKGVLVIPEFTKIEKKLIPYLSSDLQYKEIAAKLFMSIHTLIKHKQNILKKIGLDSREGLILFSIINELNL